MSKDNKKRERILSIDAARGLIMIIMLIDHSRECFGYFTSDPTDIAHTTPGLFMTRWITHFCAPLFIFLAGISAFLYLQKSNDKKLLSRFLFTRGLWIIFLEIVIISPVWSMNQPIVLQVMWAIGCSMVILSALIWLPNWLILSISLLLIFLHNALDSYQIIHNHPIDNLLWHVLHVPLRTGKVFILYPLIPWVGVMALGYWMGHLYLESPEKRRLQIVLLGILSLLLFVVLRSTNIYGDAYHWGVQTRGWIFSILSFLNVTKYPPSLQYLLLTLGFGYLLLAILEKAKGWIVQFLLVYGRVPLFFYLIHLYTLFIIESIYSRYILHLPMGWWQQLNNQKTVFSSGYHFALWHIYFIWLLVLAISYPLCKWYGQYKKNNKNKWWLSYL